MKITTHDAGDGKKFRQFERKVVTDDWNCQFYVLKPKHKMLKYVWPMVVVGLMAMEVQIRFLNWLALDTHHFTFKVRPKTGVRG